MFLNIEPRSGEVSSKTSGRKEWKRHAITILLILAMACLAAIALSVGGIQALADSRLPGEDASDKLEAAGTLLKILDTGIFKWGARVFAGLGIMAGGWALKEQRFPTAVICIVGSMIIGTAPKWVKNIFDVGDNQGIFSQIERLDRDSRVCIRSQFEGRTSSHV